MQSSKKTLYHTLNIEITPVNAIDIIVTSGFNGEDDDFVKKTSAYNLDDDTLS